MSDANNLNTRVNTQPQAAKERMGVVHLTHKLGWEISMNFTSLDQVPIIIKRAEKRGWRSGNAPEGGFRFPLAAEANFDWSAIGAYTFMHAKKGEEPKFTIVYKGKFYERRPLAEVDGKYLSMQEAVKYSRGAERTDPPHLVEPGKGNSTFVTLALFRGPGRIDPLTQKPGTPLSVDYVEPETKSSAA